MAPCRAAWLLRHCAVYGCMRAAHSTVVQSAAHGPQRSTHAATHGAMAQYPRCPARRQSRPHPAPCGARISTHATVACVPPDGCMVVQTWRNTACTLPMHQPHTHPITHHATMHTQSHPIIAWRMGVDGWQHTSVMGNGASTQLLVAMAATTPASPRLISLHLAAHGCMWR